jgi:KRAB domain-containing zinc finger protein
MCGRGFESEKELKYHRSGAHIIRPYKCEFCDKTFKKKESLIEHRRLHIRIPNMPVHREMVMSAGGSNEFVDVVEEEDESFGEKFECEMCGIVLNTQSLLDQHKHQHETATEQYKCDLCSKIFFSLDLLNIHCKREHKVILNPKVGTCFFVGEGGGQKLV